MLCLVVAAAESFSLYVLSKFAERYDAHSYGALIRRALGRKLASLLSAILLVYCLGSCIAYLVGSGLMTSGCCIWEGGSRACCLTSWAAAGRSGNLASIYPAGPPSPARSSSVTPSAPWQASTSALACIRTATPSCWWWLWCSSCPCALHALWQHWVSLRRVHAKRPCDLNPWFTNTGSWTRPQPSACPSLHC